MPLLLLWLLGTTPLSAQSLQESAIFWRQEVARTCQGFPAKDDCDDGDSMIFNGLLCFSGEEQGCETVRASQDVDGRFWRSPRRNPGNLGEGSSFSRDQSLGVLLYLVQTRDREAAQNWLRWIERNRSCRIKNPLTGGCSLWTYRTCRDNDNEICTLTPATWGLIKRVWDFLELPTTHEMRNNESLDVSDLEIISAEKEKPGYALHLKAVASLLRFAMNSSVSRSRDIVKKIYDRQSGNPFFQYLVDGPSPALVERLLQLCPKPGDDLSFRRFQWAWERDTSSEAWRESMGWDCIFMSRLAQTEAPLLPDTTFLDLPKADSL